MCVCVCVCVCVLIIGNVCMVEKSVCFGARGGLRRAGVAVVCNTPHQNAAQEAEKIKEYAQIVKERDRAVAQVCLWFGFLCVSLCVCAPGTDALAETGRRDRSRQTDRQTDRIGH